MDKVFVVMCDGMDSRRCSAILPFKKEADMMAKQLNAQDKNRPPEYAISFSVVEMDRKEAETLMLSGG